ncbi:helix-turn-helix transcriptional regulator [Glaciihabitans tibetensis]|uniref:helix-turn-helix transcriptional regulator n=1 Tax=Glaciihabitans tibetensis TaxID=1266600 RepID=UPI001FE51AB2|nr:helix-turn-helix transcriptional regulator [Glaciihabitans tibetensis]
MLLGRTVELRTLGHLVASARNGLSSVLVVNGEPGVGKTALFDAFASGLVGAKLVRLAGVESEASLSYAAVHRLVLPVQSAIADIPPGQQEALNIALGRASGSPPDRFLVGLAVMSLLAATAGDTPLVVIVDDIQWLDPESLSALAFVARRLQAEAIVFLFGLRDNSVDESELAGLPRLAVSGLGDNDALSLLHRAVTTRVEPRVARRIVAATKGNPLALLDLGAELTEGQLVLGPLGVEPGPIGTHLEAHYLRQTRELPADTQLWLLVAATETRGHMETVDAAAAALGLHHSAGDAAELHRLVVLSSRIDFRHPLVRSAVYGGAADADRRRVHRALATVLVTAQDEDLCAWHSGAGTRGQSESVAAQLEAAANRAGERGGFTSRTTLLVRAAELSPPGRAREARVIAAAESAAMAGAVTLAMALIEQLVPEFLDDVTRGRALMVRASTRALSGVRAAVTEGPALYLEAAAAFESAGSDLAASAVLRAVEGSMTAHWAMRDTTLGEIGERALAIAAEATSLEATVLRAIGLYIRGPIEQAAPALREALRRILDPDLADTDLLRFGFVAVVVTNGLWEERSWQQILRRAVAVARAAGALSLLDSFAYMLSLSHTQLGELGLAEEVMQETNEVRTALGFTTEQLEFLQLAEFLAWRDGSRQTIEQIERSAAAAAQLGFGGSQTLADFALAMIALADGSYDRAYALLEPIRAENFIQVSDRTLPHIVEAAWRSGRTDEARAAERQMARISAATGSLRARGLSARSAAIVASDSQAEGLYLDSIALLGGLDAARSRLLYGEWLRRMRRRRESRSHLRQALDAYEQIGAAPFADRARRELAATGQLITARTRAASDLTPQEAAIARLAASGSTNSEVGAALFISPNTVDYHLRKVFRKLGITSRRQLAAALDAGSTES